LRHTKFYYKNVPRLGNVSLTIHAIDQMEERQITSEAFERVLYEPIVEDIPEGFSVVRRERDGVRLVILLKPKPNKGSKVITTIYRVQAPAVAHA
jgi:hypothetical protein